MIHTLCVYFHLHMLSHTYTHKRIVGNIHMYNMCMYIGMCLSLYTCTVHKAKAHTRSLGNQEEGRRGGGRGGDGGNAHLLQQLLAMTPQGTQLAIEEAAQVHHSFLLLFRQLQGCLQKNETQVCAYVSDDDRSLLRQRQSCWQSGAGPT